MIKKSVLILFVSFLIPFASFNLARVAFNHFIYKLAVDTEVDTEEAILIPLDTEKIDGDTNTGINNGISFPAVPSYFLKKGYSLSGVSARSFLVADLDTSAIIKEKDKNSPMPIASITKLMTALVSLEAINPYSVAEVSENAISTYGDAGSLRPGEKLVVKTLLYPLLLESSNDAAIVLAEQIGQEEFVELMNKKASSTNLFNTQFDDASGLGLKNLSTVEDLFRLARYIYQTKNSIFQATKRQKFVFNDPNTKMIHVWQNNNLFAENEEFLGGKNGYTPEARETMLALFSVSLGEFENRKILIVLLGSEHRYADAYTILNWLKSSVVYGIQG